MRSLVLVALLSACGASGGQVDVAPQVQPQMYQLTDLLVSLDRAAQQPDPAQRQAAVLKAIDSMEAITRDIAEGKLREAHKLLENEIDGFLEEIHRARAAAAATPPNYYWAGKIHATCIRCHDPEGGIWDR